MGNRSWRAWRLRPLLVGLCALPWIAGGAYLLVHTATVGGSQSAPSLTPGPLGAGLGPGWRVPAGDVQRWVPFRVLTPTVDGLGQPDEAYVDSLQHATSAYLLYRARTGLPRAAATGVGMVLTEFQGHVETHLLSRMGFRAQPVPVLGQPGYWIRSKGPSTPIGEGGSAFSDQSRLDTPALVWDHGSLALRLEAALSERKMLQIADSIL